MLCCWHDSSEEAADSREISNREISSHAYGNGHWNGRFKLRIFWNRKSADKNGWNNSYGWITCYRRSDSRVRAKNWRRKKKETKRGRGVQISRAYLYAWNRLMDESIRELLLFCRSKEQCKTSKRKTWVVYHLHWQTGQITVWANGKQNSALVNFVPKSRLTFAQISSIYRKWESIAKTDVSRTLTRWNWRLDIQSKKAYNNVSCE